MDVIGKAKALRKAGKLVIGDRYKDMNAPKECKGISKYGDEVFGYVYCPDYFVKSDLSGAMCRHYVTIDGVTFHPDEIDRAVVGKDGSIKISKRETIIITFPDGYKERRGSFDTALFELTYHVGNKGDQEITLTSAGRSATQTRQQWVDLYNSLAVWTKAKGSTVTDTFQEWLDRQ